MDFTESLTGSVLIAMPSMQDPRFERSVIYVCAHNPDGAMGLVINRLIDSISFPDLLKQLSIEPASGGESIRVHFGGPVESGRGFVLHSTDYKHEGTLEVDDDIGLTATVEILRDIAVGEGPRLSFLALGYAGWGPGQLDRELQENAWLHVSPDEALVFDDDIEGKWERSIRLLGVSPAMLSAEGGSA